MINKDDIMELHETIVVLKNRQHKAKKLAKELLAEIDDMEQMLKVLTNEYETLKRKAEKKLKYGIQPRYSFPVCFGMVYLYISRSGQRKAAI